MKISFNLEYRTNWGESLYICGSCPALGAGNPALALKLDIEGNDRWHITVDVPDADSDFTYSYIVRHLNGAERHEWGKPHHFCAAAPADYKVNDHWLDRPLDQPFYSSAFTDCILHRHHHSAAVPFAPGMLSVQVYAPVVAPGHKLMMVGAAPELGNWTPKKGVEMSDAEYPLWTANVPLTGQLKNGTEFKFVIVDGNTLKPVMWDQCDNRKIYGLDAKAGATVISGLRFVSTYAPWHGAGTAIPVFSLRTEKDFGVGEFYDLIPLIDWAKATNQTFIQILPINDTTMTGSWTDSYPYNANSTFALHPMYLHLPAMGELNDAERRNYFADLAAELNALPQVDYERVNNAKNAYTRELFMQQAEEIVKDADFNAFVARNDSWLKPYAAYCVLRDRYQTADFAQWGEYATYDAEKIDDFVKHNTSYINYVYFQQYHLDKQMHHVREYAHSQGIAIKGDIPIGISRTSVDAWIHPALFFLESQAGAPPDDFSVLGQNWGFPTYNWEEMSRDGFAWWKARFRKMSEYFDAYRIDHVLGFFRIWEIPMDALHGLLGHFNPALPFTADELRNSYDFWLDVDKQTTPFIMDWFLTDFFGEYTDEARTLFLDPIGDGRYCLKPDFDTQRKIVNHFAKLENDDKNTCFANGLMGLVDNVLFVPDPEQAGKYHPRISAQHTYIYRSLNEYERWCFDRLYNDFYYRRHNAFWYDKAMWKLPPLIDSTSMLVCAEDLGMIPACVPAVMSQLEILSLEIQRMPKDPNTPFGVTWNYPYYSVCTTSTHDMSGIRGWWEEKPEATQQFFNNTLRLGGKAPYFAEPWVCEKILEQHLKSPSMLCILPLQDWLSIDGDLRRKDPREEQINVPANSRHYWRYRMHITVEALLQQASFNEHVRALVAQRP